MAEEQDHHGIGNEVQIPKEINVYYLLKYLLYLYISNGTLN